MSPILKRALCVSLVISPALLSSATAIATVTQFKGQNDWVMNKETNDERFKVLQKQMRGFDMTMFETGARFNTFYFALKNQNYDMATYQWKKIKKTIVNGTERRPARKANADAMFIDSQWKVMQAAIDSKDDAKIWETFETTKAVCNACHVAEKVGFVKVVDPQYPMMPVQ
ncbi:hypothetical protein [Enterovibrio norvegicus]|uniref:hypothetical protein n=1 Tax=Enterovibrio norvegicus TaxID=188144 RepID=UPI00352C09D5